MNTLFLFVCFYCILTCFSASWQVTLCFALCAWADAIFFNRKEQTSNCFLPVSVTGFYREGYDSTCMSPQTITSSLTFVSRRRYFFSHTHIPRRPALPCLWLASARCLRWLGLWWNIRVRANQRQRLLGHKCEWRCDLSSAEGGGHFWAK